MSSVKWKFLLQNQTKEKKLEHNDVTATEGQQSIK